MRKKHWKQRQCGKNTGTGQAEKTMEEHDMHAEMNYFKIKNILKNKPYLIIKSYNYS
jgi:hypothetical protein